MKCYHYLHLMAKIEVGCVDQTIHPDLIWIFLNKFPTIELVTK